MTDGCGSSDFMVRFQAFQAVDGWVTKVTEAVRSLSGSDGDGQSWCSPETISSILQRTLPTVANLVVWNWEHTQKKGES